MVYLQMARKHILLGLCRNKSSHTLLMEMDIGSRIIKNSIQYSQTGM